MKPTPKKSVAMRLVEARDPQEREIREILRATYAKHGSMIPASVELGIHPSQFSRWIRHLGGRILGDEVVFGGRVVVAEEPAREPAGVA